MIKATGEHEGRPLTVFGLEPGNLRLLQAGKPIRVDMAELGRPDMGIVLIVFGETREEIAQSIGAGDLLADAKGNA